MSPRRPAGPTEPAPARPSVQTRKLRRVPIVRLVMDDHRLLIISPVRNEAAHIERVATGLVAQTRRPDLWLVVDDGSDDETPAILDRLTAELDFLRVVATPPDFTAQAADRLAVAAARAPSTTASAPSPPPSAPPSPTSASSTAMSSSLRPTSPRFSPSSTAIRSWGSPAARSSSSTAANGAPPPAMPRTCAAR